MCPIIKTNLALLSVVVIFSSVTCKKGSADPVSATSITEFESRLDGLRKGAKIPGMAAGIVKDGQIIWTKGYGYENIETSKPVTNTTIFHLASLTKTFASVVIMQLVKENKISLDDPVSKYGVVLNEQGTVKVIHLLTHTSEGVPGANYRYNGDRFSLLSNVIQSATGKNFAQLAVEKIMQPVGLPNTAPSNMLLAASIGFDTTNLKKNIAQGYKSNGADKVSYPTPFSAAAGLISNMNDMLKYASAYDGTLLLTDDLKAKVFSPMISNSGKELPYGFGWFVQNKDGVKFTWHYGYWVGMSSLIIRVPDKKLGFILLANCDMLSAPYRLGNGDIWVSPYAREFLKSFVLPGAKL